MNVTRKMGLPVASNIHLMTDTPFLPLQALELSHRMLNFVHPLTKTALFLPCERLKEKVGGAFSAKLVDPSYSGWVPNYY